MYPHVSWAKSDCGISKVIKRTKNLSFLGAFTLLCPKGPGYSVRNNTVDGE